MPRTKKLKYSKLEVALILKQLKRIPDWQIAEFTGVTRQALNTRLDQQDKLRVKPQ